MRTVLATPNRELLRARRSRCAYAMASRHRLGRFSRNGPIGTSRSGPSSIQTLDSDPHGVRRSGGVRQDGSHRLSIGGGGRVCSSSRAGCAPPSRSDSRVADHESRFAFRDSCVATARLGRPGGGTCSMALMRRSSSTPGLASVTPTRVPCGRRFHSRASRFEAHGELSAHASRSQR